MPAVGFSFSTITNHKLISLEFVGGQITVGVEDGNLEFQPLFSDLSSYITVVGDPYYTEGLFTILDSSISFEFYGFSGLGGVNVNDSIYELNYDSVGRIEFTGLSPTHLVSGCPTQFFLYAPSYFDIAGTSSATVDTASILSAISVAKTEILNNVPNINLAPIYDQLTTIKGYTDTLETDLAMVKDGVSGIVFQSLNGIGGEFLDGERVQVVSSKNSGVLTRDVIYSVKRSYHSLYADNAYVVLYDLESIEGYKLSCPETLLVRYVEPVIAP